MITAKSIFKNLPKAAPEVEPIQNPAPSAVCPICENEIGQARACYRLSDPSALAHYRCETAWVRAETAILLACRRAATERTSLAIAVRNGQIFSRVLDSLVDAGRIEILDDGRYILDTRADSERIVELLQAAGGMTDDSIRAACSLSGARADHLLHRLVQEGRLVCHRQGLIPWYGIAREDAA